MVNQVNHSSEGDRGGGEVEREISIALLMISEEFKPSYNPEVTSSRSNCHFSRHIPIYSVWDAGSSQVHRRI